MCHGNSRAILTHCALPKLVSDLALEGWYRWRVGVPFSIPPTTKSCRAQDRASHLGDGAGGTASREGRVRDAVGQLEAAQLVGREQGGHALRDGQLLAIDGEGGGGLDRLLLLHRGAVGKGKDGEGEGRE